MWRRGFASLSCLALSGCMSFFYYPSDKTYFDPLRGGLLFEDVSFKTESGETIHAWWFEGDKPSKASVVFFHGNAENLTSHFVNLAWMPRNHYSYLIFDYPGYGKSTGRPSPRGTVEAGRAAIQWVHARDPRPLVVIGQSLGGNIALRSVLDEKDQVPFRAVVIDASFPSYQKIAAGKLSRVWFLWPFQPLAYLLTSDRWAPEDIGRISPTPILVTHGQKDIAVEPEFGDKIYELAKEPKEIWKIADGVHGSTFWGHGQIYQKRLLNWLDEKTAPAKAGAEKAQR